MPIGTGVAPGHESFSTTNGTRIMIWRCAPEQAQETRHGAAQLCAFLYVPLYTLYANFHAAALNNDGIQ